MSEAREQHRSPARSRTPGLVLCLLVSSLPGAAQAAEVNGSARVYWTDTELADSNFASVDQSYNLNLFQRLSTTWSVRAGYSLSELDNRTDGASLFSRRQRQPRFEVFFQRPNVRGRLSYEDTSADGSTITDNFDSRALSANVAWETRQGLRLNLGLRDASNRADVSALGRRFDNRTARVDANWERDLWGLGYGGSYNRLENDTTGSGVRQWRHDVRGYVARRFADDRVSLSASALAGYVRSDELGATSDAAEAWPAAAGLAAIDPSPALGDLTAAPGLNDGDFETPLTPPIEIGGGNTFRNVGVDLGVNRPVTRLEIAVDRPSGPQLAWEVYRSVDNLFWEPVSAVLASYDPALLRYTLRFADVSDRYFKAVNVSVNSEALVSVTEVRALRDIDSLAGDGSRGSALHSVSVELGWQAGGRVRLSAGADASDDRSSFAGITRRDYRTLGARVGADVELADDLRAGVRYRYDESSERRGTPLERSVGELTAVLGWTPIPTVDAAVTAASRVESDAEAALSTARSARLRVGLALLDSLRVESQVGYNRFDDQRQGFDRDTWNWLLRLDLRPWEAWSIDGGVSGTQTTTSGAGQGSFDRTNYFLTTNWSPGSELTLTGTLLFYDEARSQSFRQTYGLSWSPGMKLAISLSWDQFEERDGNLVGSDALTVTYRLARWVQFAGSVSRSRSEFGAGAQQEVTSARLGTIIVF